MVEEYDESNHEHENNLRYLYQQAFQEEDVPCDASLSGRTMLNRRWLEIGFQSNNPRTDFRGGGHLGLLSIIYLIKYYPKEFEEMKVAVQDDKLMWLTAIASINITHNLTIYL